MKGIKSKLALKFVIGFILLGFLICATSSLVGYYQYKTVIEKQYNDTAYQTVDVAMSYIDKETLVEYVNIIKDVRDGKKTKEDMTEYVENEKYQTVLKQIVNLRRGMKANDIFFVYIDRETLISYTEGSQDWMPLWYIFDAYHEEELSYSLGDNSPFNHKYIDEIDKMMQTGERSDNYFISEGDYGYNTSALMPIYVDKNGDEIEGMLIACVEIPMTTIQSALKEYVVYAVFVTIALIIIFILLYEVYLYKRVVVPINKVAAEANGFIDNQNQISEVLDEIKTKDEIQNLAQSILKMQMDINNYISNITKITAEKERIGAELDVAKNIQASMLPCIFPAFPDRSEIDIYATMDPAKEVGGDFYDFFMVDERHLAIVVADVSGKGIPAALFMVIGKTLIKDHTTPGVDLGQVFSEVNNLLCESNSEGLFITAFEGVLDLVTGEFNFVNAGHEMPFISRGSKEFEVQKLRPGFVLAGMEDMKYCAGSMVLEPGDKIFQYTDGVPEATNQSDELYGMERLANVLNKVKDKTPHEILPAVKSDIDVFVGEAEQFDDITMLCLEYKFKMEWKENV